jgi:DNA-binding transcriptional regulator YiaG
MKHPSPEPHIVAAWREAAGLTQAQAAALVYVSTAAWQRWEDRAPGSTRARGMPYGLYELFCLKVEKMQK